MTHRVLIIGTGSIGERHLRCFLATDRAEAGFVEPRMELVTVIRRAASPEEFFDGILSGTVRGAALLRAQTPPAQAAIRADLLEALRSFEKDGVIEAPAVVALSSALKR